MSSGNFKYDFKDMAKYMEDLAILKQYGGNDVPETVMKMEQNIPKWKSILIFIGYMFLWAFAIYALYLVYYIVFKGYPKWIVNLFTMRFSKKADMDKLIKENNVLLGNFSFLLDKNNSYKSIYSVFSEIYGDNKDLINHCKDLINHCRALDNFIVANYDYPYDDKYMMAFREYFLFFFKIITNRVDNKCDNPEALYKTSIESTRKDKSRDKKKNDSNSDFLSTTNNNFDRYKIVDVRDDKEQNVKACIHHFQFYEALANYLVSIGKLNKKHKTRDGDKNDEELIYQVFIEDMKNAAPLDETNATLTDGQIPSSAEGVDAFRASNGKYYTMIKNLKELVLNVSRSASSLNTHVNSVNNNILPYLVLPSTDNDIKNAITDYRNNIGRLDDLYRPGVRFAEMNEFSWYIFEALYYGTNKNSFDTFSTYVAGIAATPELRAYLNLSSDKRAFANQRLKMQINDAFAEISKKCPVFAHIYFSEVSGMDKRGLYNKVMSAYNKLMNMDSGYNPNDNPMPASKNKMGGGSSEVKSDFDLNVTTKSNIANPGEIQFQAQLNNLDINGGNLKKTFNAINVMHLYLNQYALTINKNYEKQYISDTNFFKELINPVFHEMIVNRVFIAWYENVWRDSYFGPPFPTKHYKEFTKKYRWFEDIMSDVVKQTWKRLFTSSKIKDPKPAEQGL